MIRIIALSLLAFSTPVNASVLNFEWVGISKTIVSNGNDTGFPYVEVTYYPKGWSQTYFSFELPTDDILNFEYAVTYDWGDKYITTNPQDANTIKSPDNYLSPEDGYYIITLNNGVVNINLNIFEWGDHVYGFSNNGISVDHNQGDIIEFDDGYWRAVHDNVIIGTSATGVVNPAPVPLPASLPLLLVGSAALIGLRRRRS